MAGISYAAFAEWHRRANDESDECQELYGKFVNEVARARADYLAVIEATFDKQVEDSGDWRGTLSKLKVFYPEIWNVPEKHELTGADGGPIQTQAQVVEIPAPIADVTAWAASAVASKGDDE